jgi:uncharacterized protein YkwD
MRKEMMCIRAMLICSLLLLSGQTGEAAALAKDHVAAAISIMPGVDQEERQEDQLLRLVNQERISCSAQMLMASSQIDTAAKQRAKELLDDFGLARPDGRPGISILDDMDIPYSSASENIIRGHHLSAENAFRIWMGSAGECANIRDKRYGYTGIAKASGADGMVYWVQIFVAR